ncbi:MAG: YwqG family protein, partial [Bacteroidia bacterium]
ATPVTDGEILPIKQSKFLGKPFLPVDKLYPKSKNGTPMIMLAQINFAEAPALENYPASGILQLFVSPTDWYDMDDYYILFHENVDQDFQTDFSFLTSDLYEESPINCEHKLTFSKEIEYGGTEDFRFQLNFNGKSYYDYQETLSKSQQEEMDKLFYTIGHKIGGYAYFTQSDPRDYDKLKKNDVLLLQIDTDDEIMFGDSGVANVFINIDELKNKNFDKAYFNWDCC